jgi:hypothetical protein
MINLEKCIHHWIIESSTGPISEGECQKCNQKKDFSNSIGMKDMPRSLNLQISNHLSGRFNN